MENLNELYESELYGFNNNFRKKDLYINRELSWIEFNKRVLHQSIRKEVPLLERLNFLGISASNLYEFIMVRLSSVKKKILNDIRNPDISGLTPYQEFNTVSNEVLSFRKYQSNIYDKLLRHLHKENISIATYESLSSTERDYISKVFGRNIFPLLTPITYDTTKDFPLIKSKQLNIIVSLEDRNNRNLNVMSIIPIDNGLERLYKIEDEFGGDKYILLEDIVYHHLHKIFMNKNILYKGTMMLLREADIELEHDKDVYLIDRMKQTLIKRDNGYPIYMEVNEDIPKGVLKLLVKMFDLEKRLIYKSNNVVDYSFLTERHIKNHHLEYKPFSPQYPQELIGEHDMFTAIDSNDIILHHPYESYDPIIKFLEHAASDNNVLAIRQTLYRVSSSDSPIVNALCKAAQSGKQVSVLLEIKARFDENRNMSLVEKLKLSGCKIIYGIEELKTHCKFILIIRKTNKGLKLYSHIGTGNYNDKTAKIYTDISYFTSNGKIGEDLISVFNILSGFSEPVNEINKLYFSPINLRSQLYKLIDREIENAKHGNKAFISLKMNSISDKDIIEKLYRAADEGVLITIFCRGICSMKPINKNIIIKSIIGRFLEHSRIYYFYNNNKSEIYISSADLLTRNLDKRIELLVPIRSNDVKNKLLNILMTYYKDTFNTYIMNDDGMYKILNKQDNFNIHEYFMNQAISNYKMRNIPKFISKNKKKI